MEWNHYRKNAARLQAACTVNGRTSLTVYPKKYEHGFCFAVLCCGYTLTYFPISIRLTSLALWQSNDCPSASKATLMNMDKYFMWIHYERLHNHNKAKHNKTVCIFLGIYCRRAHNDHWTAFHSDIVPSSKIEVDIFIIIEYLDGFLKFSEFARGICIALDAFYPCVYSCFKNLYWETNFTQ